MTQLQRRSSSTRGEQADGYSDERSQCPLADKVLRVKRVCKLSPLGMICSIAYNIAYGKDGATQAEVEEAAKAARIYDRIMGFPERKSDTTRSIINASYIVSWLDD